MQSLGSGISTLSLSGYYVSYQNSISYVFILHRHDLTLSPKQVQYSVLQSQDVWPVVLVTQSWLKKGWFLHFYKPNLPWGSYGYEGFLY